ncbi:GNAT family N-acetyltransferase [Leucobacter chromiireducens subsp. solipictus]
MEGMTETRPTYRLRSARPDDFDAIIAVIDEWWGRAASRDLTRLFLDHFSNTSLIAETQGEELAGFVLGFPSPAQPTLAYIHFTGVHPAHRRSGLARTLYARFCEDMRSRGCTEAKAITSPVNERSIAFHRALGFSVSAPIRDYDGPGLDRVVFRRPL